MSVVAAAVVGGSLLGAGSSYLAADKQADATKKGINVSRELALQARNDAINLFSQGQQYGARGLQNAMDFYKKSAASAITPYVQGNVEAQNVIGQGAIQANNAILGMPVDMGFTQPRQIQADTSYLNAAQPVMPLPIEQPAAAGGQAAPATPAQRPMGWPSGPRMILGGMR